ncbi:YbcC family protein [Noviherbaspirillum galbum]|uniref:Probable inorganic carbon transporter subunit DabA n=1 Tax=Noviherbaspirillum galbum TaxID=2709383 RepID=A0A6B3SMY5_9BURK|nr:DUF2309 domain-containing protein [Noviherbaspirillum galbum]NEX62113.1 DUF2309 domain-containing protein [Noviherbaspirillum galbum]
MNATELTIPETGPGLAAQDPASSLAWEAERIEAACQQACEAIAPAWPLDQAIAVNPHWARIGRPVRAVAARMAALGDIKVFPERLHFRQAWEEGRIAADDLAHALATLPAARQAGLTATQCIEALRGSPPLPRLPLLIDVLDDDPARDRRLSWRQAITHQVSQTCAAYFDEQQADWQPEREQDLYGFWRDTLTHDHGIGVLMGLPALGRRLGALPATRQEAERWVLQRLGLPREVWADYLEAVLLTVNGWASWCAYLGWQARLAGRGDAHLRDLLAIRLAWGAILLDCKEDASARRAFAALQAEWRHAPSLFAQAEDLLLMDEVWQVALEAGYQRQLARKLQAAATPAATDAGQPDVEVQAAFCIDVRSEPLRRALETSWPAVRTIGFAGFFGLPIAYAPLGTAMHRPQLPGLLAPALTVTDRITRRDGAAPDERGQDGARRARARRFAWSERWLAATRWPGAGFSTVEAAGMGYLGKLGQWLRPSARQRVRSDLAGLPDRYRALCRPALDGMDIGDKTAVAGRVLHAMGLDGCLAPLVLLVGHGSQSANNAHAAALDCGACCGQTGEVNARVLAQLLNDPAVREGLRSAGTVIPDGTVFAAALHNTTTDEIEWFDADLLPPAAAARREKLQRAFAQSCDQVRRERAARLGLDPRAGHERLLDAYRRRANDGAQTRPEWGLAGNASFIIAPRSRTRGAVLDGRSFLHDYDAAGDTDGSVLELLMTAPMVVTNWINWQYHASTCDPARLGSGNKVLHNVVGGRIGVFEGNGGDLRIGLSRQSLHDGKRWMHEPLRLTVVIDAPADRIEAIIARHAAVRDLLENGWLHLWRCEGARLFRRAGGGWQDLGLEAPQPD